MTFQNVILLFTCLTLSLTSNLRFLESGDNTYDYSKIQATSKNKNISNADLISTKADESIVYISDDNLVSIVDSIANKTGDASNAENSHYYGVNSAVLVNNAKAQFVGFNITSNAIGSNGITVVNNGEASIENLKIHTEKVNSSAIVANYGGKIRIHYTLLSTYGDSSPCLISEKDGGAISISYARMLTDGNESPIIYTVGNNISLDKTNTTTYNSQSIVMEGGFSRVRNSWMRGAGKGTYKNNGYIVMFTKNHGKTYFESENTHYMLMGGTVYPYFYVTNTKAVIKLNRTVFDNGAATLLKASGNDYGWGTKGDNGAEVTLYINDQVVEGDIEVDSISQLTINLQNSTLKGTINNAKTAALLEINMDAKSKIELTGHSYYTSLKNDDTTGSNIIKNSYSFEEYDENFDIIKNDSKNLHSKILIMMLLLIISF